MPTEQDRDRDREEDADEDFVASFHACRKGPSSAAVSASSTRIATDVITTASRRRPADALGAGLGNVALVRADERDGRAEQRRLDQAVDHLEGAEAEAQARR